MNTCTHDKRFELMFAKNGCCACELEKARDEIAALLQKIQGYDNQFSEIAEVVGGDARNCEDDGKPKTLASYVRQQWAKITTKEIIE